MNKWKILTSMIAATLCAAAAVQAQNIIFSDDFESGTLDAYNLNIGGSDVSVVSDGSQVAEFAHMNGVRTGLGNNQLAGMELSRFDFGFSLKVLSSPAPDTAFVELSRDSYAAGPERILHLDLAGSVSAQDVWDTFRVIVNNTGSALVYDQGGGIAGTVAAGQADVWRNGSVITNMALHISGNDSQSVVTQGEAASSFGFLCNKNELDTTFRVDDIVVRDLPQPALVFATSPGTTLGMPLDYPATQSSNTLYTWYHEDGTAASIDVTAITIKSESHSGAFATTATPFTLSSPSPTTGAIDITFDNSVAALTDTQTATGMVEIVWTKVGSGVSNTNNVKIQSTYSKPDAALVIDPSASLGISFKVPATAATGTVSATYIQGNLLTNVQITAISVINESHAGSLSSITALPIVIPDPESNETFQIAFDNTVAALAEGESATGQVSITWNEIGSTNNTTVLSVNVDYVTTPVMEMNFATAPNRNVPTGGGNDFSNQELNDFGRNTNGWNSSTTLSYNSGSGGSIQRNSQNNFRGGYNLIQAGTAGMDDVGVVDTVALASGLYRYEFTYDATADGVNDEWGFEAYALEGQDAYPTTANQVKWDHGNGGTYSYKAPISSGTAVANQHSGGALLGSSAVTGGSGSITVNVDTGMDALFTMWGQNGGIVKLYDIRLVRVGDYEPPVVPTSPTNAVLDASFSDPAMTNTALVKNFDYDYNDTNVNVWVHGASGVWDGGALKNTSGSANSRSIAIVTRAGSAGYDDVGVQDTLALTSGTYTVTMDIVFQANSGTGSVSVFSFGGLDATGNVNDVRLDLGEGTNDAVIVEQKLVPILRGSAFFTELARKDYTANLTETLVFTGLSVQDGEDLCIRLNGYANGDFNTIDNVQVLRTGDAAPVGYDAWVASYGLTGNDALPGTDVEPDGLDNLLEYALGGIPNVDDAAMVAPSASFAMDAGTNWQYHVHNERTDDPRLSYELGRKLDLVFGTNWTTGAIEFIGESADVGNIKSVTNRAPTLAPKAFLRLKVDKAN